MKKKQTDISLREATCATRLEEVEKFLASISRNGSFDRGSLEQIRLAYRIAKAGHFGQLRDNGAPYFEHVRDTTHILVDELGINDCAMICAALLHDTVEDSPEDLPIITPILLKLLFGQDVHYLVDIVTKPKRSDQRFKSDRARHQYYFNRLFKEGDCRVKLVKLCDRLHNLRTLRQCSPEKRERKIKETIEVYLPLLRDICKQYPKEARYLKQQFDFCLRGFKIWAAK